MTLIKRVVRRYLRYSHLVVFVSFFFTIVMLLYAQNISFDPSFSSLIASDTESNTNERLLANVLENSDVFIIVVKVDEQSFLSDRVRFLDDPSIQGHFDVIRQTMEQSKYVSFVSPIELNDDAQFARILVRVNTPRTVDGFALVIDDVNRYFSLVDSYPGLDISITGFPLLLNQVNTLIITDNIKTIAFTIIAIFLVLWFYFRNIRLTLITLSVPVMGVIILGGIMSLYEIPISITLAIIGILTVGLGVDFAIHLIVSYESYLERGYSHVESIVNAVKHLYVAIIASFLTTAAGFSALLFGVSPATQGQGIVLLITISVIAFLTICYFPCSIYVFGAGVLPDKNSFFQNIKDAMGRLAVLQTRRPKTVLVLLGVMTLIMMFGVIRVGFDTSNDNWIPSNDPIQESFRINSYAFGNDFSSLQIVLQSDNLRNIQTIRDIQRLENAILAIPEVERVTSPFSSIELDVVSVHEQLPYDRYPVDFVFTTISVQAISFDSDAGGSSAVLDEIREVIDQHPIYFTQISLFGDVLRFRELGISLGRDTGVTTVLSFVLVFIIASLIYLSVSIGMIALVPIIVGIIWTLGLMGFFSVPFTSLSTGLIALVLGIGIDFSIHLVNSTRNYLREGLSIEDALTRTMSYSGGALLLTSITTFIGFFSLVLAGLLGIQRLGISLALSIASVFLVTIIMVPSVLSLVYSAKMNKKTVVKKRPRKSLRD